MIVPKDHPLADRSQVDLSEMINDPFVHYQKRLNLRHTIDELCKEWVQRAAEKGKHILCEKPASLTAAEASEVRNIT